MAAVAELSPSYLKLLESGELRERVEEAWERMRTCDLCPRNCRVLMPNGPAGTEVVLKFIAEELSPETYVNLMAQYRPCDLADQFPEIAHPLS